MKPTKLVPFVLSTLLPLATALLPPLAPAAYAQQPDRRAPGQVLKTTIDEVMAAIASDPAARAGDPDRTFQIVQQRFLPSTDFMLTTQYAVGPAWAGATPAQREALFRQFQTLLARTYAMQLTQLGGQDTHFSYGPAAHLAPGAADAIVRSTVTTGGDTMAIGYRMHKTDAGWKIYDIDMMGAWMIPVYRQQFAARLASGGVDGLISFLAAHNAGG